MTCVIGLETPNGIIMGADSMAASGWDKTVTRASKVFIKDDRFIIGYTTSFRMGQLLQFGPEIQKQGDESDMEYMVRTFIEWARSTLKDGGFSKINSNQEEGGNFLVGYNGVLYNICDDFQVNPPSIGFDAIGCGSNYAKAAMAALEGLPPRGRIERSLDIAAMFSNGVCAPFVVMNMGKNKE